MKIDFLLLRIRFLNTLPCHYIFPESLSRTYALLYQLLSRAAIFYLKLLVRECSCLILFYIWCWQYHSEWNLKKCISVLSEVIFCYFRHQIEYLVLRDKLSIFVLKDKLSIFSRNMRKVYKYWDKQILNIFKGDHKPVYWPLHKA